MDIIKKISPRLWTAQQDTERLALTWAPKPIYINISDQWQHHLPILKKLSKNALTLELYAEMTMNGNLHYHASLTVKDQIKWWRSTLPLLKHHGFVTIKKRLNENWDVYIQKQRLAMQSLLKIALPLTTTHEQFRNLKRKVAVPDAVKEGTIHEQMMHYDDK